MNKEIYDPTRNKMILINKCSVQAVTSFPEMKIFHDVEYPAYAPENSVIAPLKHLVQGKKIVIVLGTWCGDSKLLLPRFIKLMDLIMVDEQHIALICVDGNKKAENGLIDSLNITNVPTFIVYQGEKELGRIVEMPVISLEEDLLLILEKE